MKIRSVQSSDSPKEINALLAQLSPNAHQIQSMTTLVNVPKYLLTSIVGVKNGRIIAFGCVTRRYVQSRGWVTTIEDVIVDKLERSQRYGQKLMEGLMEIAATDYQADCIELTSNDYRIIAQELYKKFGFEKIATTFYRKKL